MDIIPHFDRVEPPVASATSATSATSAPLAGSAELRRRATGHALSLIGSYQSCNRPELIEQIRSLDPDGWNWVLTARPEVLRMMFLPMSQGRMAIADWCK
jgi:hypothetical protein